MQTITSKMSQGLHENLLSYQFSKKERTQAASSSTGSPPSPGESIANRSSQISTRQRPQLTVRPRSSGDAGRHKIKIQLIEEKTETQANQSNHWGSAGSRVTQDFPHCQDAKIPFADVSRSSNRKSRSSDSLPPPPEPQESSVEVHHGKRKTSRPSWTRTRSGGVWYYLRQRDTSSHDGSSVRSKKSVHPLPKGSESINISIVPMKPPPRPQVLQTSQTNHIVVETPFGQQDDAGIISPITRAMLNAEGRRPSIDVKRLFSVPLTVLRRSRIDKSKEPSPSPAQTRSSTNIFHAQSHDSVAESDHTAANLDRVSSLLERYLKPTVASRLRSCSHLTKSSSDSDDQDDSRQSRTKALIGAFRIPRSHSIGQIAVTASSIFKLRMSSTPRNSPTERATYKIKRRPSAATEEFVKIDISVRDGTSYLPSEARRISTPPLPGDSKNPGRRGFFFDYDAARNDEDFGGLELSRPNTQIEDAEQTDHQAHDETGVNRSTSTNLQQSQSRKRTTKTTAGDWYEIQLADLDAMCDDDEERCLVEPGQTHQCKHECQARLAEISRQLYEAQLDHSIPEHLPNSPLCPRNPKYWRVRQQKGSQFRGCWMHGFGEYDIVPGLYK